MISSTQISGDVRVRGGDEVVETPLGIARLASPAATHRDDVSAANSIRQAERNLSDGEGEAKGMSSV